MGIESGGTPGLTIANESRPVMNDHPSTPSWATPKLFEVLGKVSDQECAEKFGVSTQVLARYRNKIGLPSFQERKRNSKSLGAYLARIRADRPLSKMGFGFRPAYLRRVEEGEQPNLQMDTMRRLALAYGTTMERLCGFYFGQGGDLPTLEEHLARQSERDEALKAEVAALTAEVTVLRHEAQQQGQLLDRLCRLLMPANEELKALAETLVANPGDHLDPELARDLFPPES